MNTPLSDYESLSTEELEEAVQHLHDLKRHPGYQILQAEMVAQVETLVGLLIDADEGNVRIAQGSLRALRDLIESENPARLNMRQNLVAAFTEIIEARAEEKRIREDHWNPRRKSDI